MSMSKRPTELQEELWLNTAKILMSPGHPFYQRLNELLAEHGFDGFVEGRCAQFHATNTVALSGFCLHHHPLGLYAEQVIVN